MQNPVKLGRTYSLQRNDVFLLQLYAGQGVHHVFLDQLLHAFHGDDITPAVF